MSRNKARHRELIRQAARRESEAKRREFSVLGDDALIELRKNKDLSVTESMVVGDLLDERGLSEALREAERRERDLALDEKLARNRTFDNLGWGWLAVAFLGGILGVSFPLTLIPEFFSTLSISSATPVEGFADLLKLLGALLAIVAFPFLALFFLVGGVLAVREHDENLEPVFVGSRRVLLFVSYYLVLCVSGYFGYLLST